MAGYKRYGCPCCRPSSSSATSASAVAVSSASSSSASSSGSSSSTNCCSLLPDTIYLNVNIQLYPYAQAFTRPPASGVRCFTVEMNKITKSAYIAEVGADNNCCDVNNQQIWHGEQTTPQCLTCNELTLHPTDGWQKCKFTAEAYYHCCCDYGAEEGAGGCDFQANHYIEIVPDPDSTGVLLGLGDDNCCISQGTLSCDDEICWTIPNCGNISGHCGSDDGAQCWNRGNCCTSTESIHGCDCNGSIAGSCMKVQSTPPTECASDLAGCDCLIGDDGGGGGGGGSPMIASAIDARTGRPLIDIFKEMGHV